MNGDKFIYRFFITVIIFIISILLMITIPRLFRILFGWDLLALVSHCLIIYYDKIDRITQDSGHGFI